MKVEKIDHIAILVDDLSQAERFFTNLLGTKFTRIGEFKETDIKSSIDPVGIELIEPLTPDGPTAKSLKTRGGGLHLLSLRVTDVDEAMAEMKSKGIRLIAQARVGKDKAALYHPKDTYGVMLELIGA
jgi:methylmalonyl-CoA/ethylmalonyl-CoA epimerase